MASTDQIAVLIERMRVYLNRLVEEKGLFDDPEIKKINALLEELIERYYVINSE